MMKLHWLPSRSEWEEDLSATRKLQAAASARRLLELTQCSLDFMQTARLDKALREREVEVRPLLQRSIPLKLALIGSSTLAHLAPGIRVGGARRGIWVEVFEGHYGSYHQELADSQSDLYQFSPDVVLLSLDAHHVVAGEQHHPGRTMETLKDCWRLAQEGLGATVIQQTVLPVFPPLLGNNEHTYVQSPSAVLSRVNQELRTGAKAQHVALLSVDALAQEDGTNLWFEPALWHRFKQEMHPRMSHLYGDHVARLLAAGRGLSYKCLVLDLDNTLWGGVIGDDGLDGILLGQGHAVGEAFTSFQRYVKGLGERGVILAVCSKNDEANAQMPFERHPEMVLRSQDMACFVANWEDKAANIRTIATTLNIGLDSIVFADDNPFERNLVRRELPMVAVPELPEDPALYARAIAAAGYFEALGLTAEDRERNKLYLQNAQRERSRAAASDMAGYLRSLDMRLYWSRFQPHSLTRVTQLINRSNQFNLTTRRYTYEDIRSLSDNASVLTLQLRLVDAFGDNGLIAVVVGRMTDAATLEVDTWLMSCRVLGRQVEEATLNLLVAKAREFGAEELIGVYIPTAKNGMVKQHYGKLGFERVNSPGEERSVWNLRLQDYAPRETSIRFVEAELATPGETDDSRTDIQPAYAGLSERF